LAACLAVSSLSVLEVFRRGLLVELDQPFMAAEVDDQVRVVILAGAGPQFSSGHDMGSKEAVAERDPVLTSIPRCASTGGTRAGAE
jgi:enoyl-CoA hydratase